MTVALKILWMALHAAVAVPTLLVVLQMLLARSKGGVARPAASQALPFGSRVAVLVPAHNESRGVVATLTSIKPQLRPGDRLLVVADNCSDDTAEVARAQGAEVLERFNTSLRGKGFALDHGIQHLKLAPPAFVLMCDADCHLAPGSLEQLASSSAKLNQPVQALDLMQAREGAGMQQRFAEFAWRVKNQVRPSGSQRLGIPCPLMGTGMIFPWAVIENAPLASGHLAEDMQLGVNLALNGHLTSFDPAALVTSRFPDSAAGSDSQRARWEHGALANLLDCVPRLLSGGIRLGRFQLIGMALDLLVPPLALLVMILGALMATDALLWWLSGWSLPLFFAGALLACFAGSIVLVWRRFGQGTITARELLFAPWYAVRKLPLYLAFLIRRQTGWVRAKRDGE